MSHIRAAFAVALAALAQAARADDWPTFRNDLARSSVSDETVDAQLLEQAWAHVPSAPPNSAWPGPAKWDAYATLAGMRSMRDYDSANHVIVVGDALYYASNADHAVHCLDARSGEARWTFTAGAPVRIAPHYADGKLYFGADDGYAYCIDATTGARIWSFSPAPDAETVLNNGSLISTLPIRTGVAIADGTAYFGASFLPWQASYLCAVDAQTGKPEGQGRYVHELGLERTLEGALLVSPTALIVPQGRVAPMLFDRATGKSQGVLDGGGGAFCLIADDRVVHGPGNKGGWLTDSAADRTKVASYDRGTAMLVDQGVSYLLRPDALGAIDRATQTPRWTTKAHHPHAMIKVGDALFLGGDDEVAAHSAESGELLWTAPVQGRAHGLAFAHGRLYVSTDEGLIHCFDTRETRRPAEHPVAQQAEASPAPPIRPFTDASLLDRWVFQANTLTAPNATTLRNLARGPSATIEGVPEFSATGSVQSLALDAVQSGVSVAENFVDTDVPTRDITIEAWVRVDAPTEWGGIASITQDNGAYERGWMLGYRKDKPGFALAGADGGDGLTWLIAKDPLTLGAWHHLAATYDGLAMRLYVDGVLTATSTSESGDILYPEHARYYIGAYYDDDEHFRMRGAIHEVRVYERTLKPNEIKQHHDTLAEAFPDPIETTDTQPTEAETFALATGPYVAWQDPQTAIIRWTTAEPSATDILIGSPELGTNHGAEVANTSPTPNPTTSHEITVTQLRPERVYTMQIAHTVDGKPQHTPSYEFDTSFNYTSDATPPTATNALAEAAIEAATTEQGYAVVLGIDDLDLLRTLVGNTRFRVLAFDVDPVRVAAAREALQSERLYGTRVSVHPLQSFHSIPAPDAFANLVIAPTAMLFDQQIAGAVGRITRPLGGTIVVDETTPLMPGDDLGADDRGCSISLIQTQPRTIFQKGAVPGAADWTHMYADPDNAAYAGEKLGGATSIDDLRLTWIGRPGPRYQSDRGNRKPSPLSTNGRLFMQGLNRVIAVDAYNGTILWSLELPTLQRFNIPRDASNWCADDDYLYLAQLDDLWVIDAATGALVETQPVLEPDGRDWESDWGYIASVDDLLVGSAVKKGSAFTGWWGPEFWYDAKDGEHAKKVCSDKLFAIRKDSGSSAWTYEQRSVIVNATITILRDAVYFVESRAPAVVNADTRRLDGEDFWKDQQLVSLDVRTGEVRWRKPIETIPGISAFYLAGADDTLVAVSSREGMFGIYAFDTQGESKWEREIPWEVDHHGKHLSRPAVLRDRIIVRPYILDVATGQDMPYSFPTGHQCGTYSCSENAVFLRAGNLTMWDQEDNSSSTLNRVRPDCWVSTIPAQGMLLSPEGGGGCSCGSWLETSMGLMPRVP